MFKHGKKEHQKSLFDLDILGPSSMTGRLQKTWAEGFFHTVFLNVNEDRFAVLYSDKLSRPNKPVNILVSLLILKELNDLTDEELIDSYYFDYRFQHALGISDLSEESLCINTLTNFRSRLVAYEAQTGIDLLHEEMASLSNKLAEYMGLNKNMARMDSLMVASSCKKMSRLELVYTVIRNMVRLLDKTEDVPIPEPFKNFLDDKHEKETLYRTKSDQTETKLDILIKQASDLFRFVQEDTTLQETEAFEHLKRLLNEQCSQLEDGTFVALEGNQIAPSSLQNPSDPDATYRNKGGKDHVGYSLNVVEVHDQESGGSLILSHAYKANSHSDAQYGETFVEEHPLSNEINTLSVDGAYYRPETVEKAKEKDMKINFSQLTGRSVKDDQIGVDQFTIDAETNEIKQCPAGHEPVKTTYNKDNDVYTAKFDKATCNNCPLQAQCPIQEQKKYNNVRFTGNKLQTDSVRSQFGTERHKELSNYRAGIEGIPSVLRRVFHIDHIPVRGFVRSKIWVNAKLMALNFKMFWNHG
ncbi:transposase, partial [Bacillaceae bacterium S4-13-58]